MEPERFRALLDAYGGDPQRWPGEERAAMQAFLVEHAEAETWRREAQALDLALAAYHVDALDLSARILDGVPRSPLERFVDWLLPGEVQAWWRPAMAAAVPLFLGVAIGLADPGDAGTTVTDSDWTTQEQSLLASGLGSAWYE